MNILCNVLNQSKCREKIGFLQTKEYFLTCFFYNLQFYNENLEIREKTYLCMYSLQDSCFIVLKKYFFTRSSTDEKKTGKITFLVKNFQQYRKQLLFPNIIFYNVIEILNSLPITVGKSKNGLSAFVRVIFTIFYFCEL